ncbi:helix-turn-helix domain-containing protein, partial [Listeria costaricensis]|uniref:helix-turn-helix domain-containing protein n=1 Tax=Listeria costaricensis TaxID=2026604 RepID=UPI0013C4407D
MLKNKLKQILEETGISQSELSRKSGISRQGIKKIVDNPFHAISGHTLSELLMALKILFDDLCALYTKEEYLLEKLLNRVFSEKSLKLLTDILYQKTKLYFKFDYWASGQTLRLSSKGYYENYSFSGYIRITTNLDNPTF